jgi:hypothetical protein
VVLIPQRFWSGLTDGSITLAFRRWDAPRVKTGSQMHSPVGLLAVDAVEEVDRAAISESDAVAAGYTSLVELRRELDKRGAGAVYRIVLRRVGPDPRETLRNAADLTDAEVAAIRARLDRLDRASSHGPWTDAVLACIAERPGVRAPDLAASFGRETQPFKIDVRKLKALGLTESLTVGYRISPRGQVFRERAG